MERTRQSSRLKSQTKKKAKGGLKEQHSGNPASSRSGKLQTKRKHSPVDPPHGEKKRKTVSILFFAPRS